MRSPPLSQYWKLISSCLWVLSLLGSLFAGDQLVQCHGDTVWAHMPPSFIAFLTSCLLTCLTPHWTMASLLLVAFPGHWVVNGILRMWLRSRKATPQRMWPVLVQIWWLPCFVYGRCKKLTYRSCHLLLNNLESYVIKSSFTTLNRSYKIFSFSFFFLPFLYWFLGYLSVFFLSITLWEGSRVLSTNDATNLPKNPRRPVTLIHFFKNIY